MAHHTAEHNPFMLLINPEVVLAAMEKSERLGQLNRHLCRPLDRPTPAGNGNATTELPGDELDAADEADLPDLR